MATPAKRLTMPTIPMFLSTTKRSITSIIRNLNVSIKYDVTVLGTLLIRPCSFPNQPLLLHRMVIETQTALAVVLIGMSHRHFIMFLVLRIHRGRQLLIKYMGSVSRPPNSYLSLIQFVHRLKYQRPRRLVRGVVGSAVPAGVEDSRLYSSRLGSCSKTERLMSLPKKKVRISRSYHLRVTDWPNYCPQIKALMLDIIICRKLLLELERQIAKTKKTLKFYKRKVVITRATLSPMVRASS